MQALPPLSCGQSFKLICQNYCNFSGRSRRSEFFYFFMTINIIIFSLFILSIILLFIQIRNDDILTYIYLFCIVIDLTSFIPILSSTIRRLHDTGRPGWYILFYIIPYILILMVMLFFCI